MGAIPPPDWRIWGSPYEGQIGRGRDENGQPFDRLVGVFDRKESINTIRPLVGGEYNVYYPKLRQDEIIPAWGMLYRFEGQPRPGGEYLSRIQTKKPLTKVPLLKTIFLDLPEDVVPEPSSYTIPLKGSGQLRGLEFEVVAIQPETKTKNATAEIQFYVSRIQFDEKTARVTIEKGGDFRLGPRSYHVRNIVPANANHHLIGWIELDPEPHVPDAPIPPWPLKTPARDLFDRMGLRHTANYEIWTWASNPWFVHTPWIGEAKAKDPRDFTIHLPVLKPGDKFPALGQIYETLSVPLDPGVPEAMVLEDRQSLPKGVALSANTFAVPLQGFGRLHGPWFRVATINTEADTPATANIEVYGENRWSLENKITAQLVTKAEDLIMIGGKNYRVVNIVPANENLQLVGWVEFDPVPRSIYDE